MPEIPEIFLVFLEDFEKLVPKSLRTNFSKSENLGT